MLQERIEHYFKQYPTLRVLFFFDAQKEYAEEFEAMTLSGIRKVKHDGRDFYLKVMLHGEWAPEKVFLYYQQPAPNTKEAYLMFPLLDLMVANKVLYLDNVADFMNEFQLGQSQRALAERFKQELKYPTVQKVLAPVLNRNGFAEEVVIKGLLSHFLGFTKIESREVLLIKLLCLSLPGKEKELERLVGKLDEHQLHPFFTPLVNDYFKMRVDRLTPKNILELQHKLKYNLITYPLDEKAADVYKQLKIKDGVVVSKMCHLTENALNHQKLEGAFRQLIESQDSQIKDDNLFLWYGPEAEYGYYTPFMKWKVLAAGIREMSYKPKVALQLFERVSLLGNNPELMVHTTGFLIHVAELMRQVNDITSYIADTPDEYIEQYTQTYYRIDQSYRKAIIHYREIATSDLPAFVEIESQKEQLESRYETYLEKLNREWLKCFAEQGFDYSQLRAPKQYDFFRNERINGEHKVVVVVSDALRYETGMSLLSELHADSKNEAAMRYQLASIPSTTQFGMANLLATGKIEMKETELRIDGISTEGLPNRTKILQLQSADGRACSYSEIDGNGQAQNRDIFKSSVVYVYHDSIDSVGDKRASERNTFKATADAIKELAALVKKLHASYNVSRVIVTADHGFIYNDRTLNEPDKEPFSDADAVLTHNRYALVKNNGKQVMGYKIPLRQVSRVESDWFVVVPESVNRYKKQGVGHQFVHGGASLQELVVPIIESTRKRSEVTERVRPLLVNKQLRVVSNILRVQILQEKRVSRNEKEREIVVGLYHDLEPVSNQVILQLNSTSELPSERSYKCDLMLRGDSGNVGMLKLKVYDKEDMLNALIVCDVINNTLIESEF